MNKNAAFWDVKVVFFFLFLLFLLAPYLFIKIPITLFLGQMLYPIENCLSRKLVGQVSIRTPTGQFEILWFLPGYFRRRPGELTSKLSVRMIVSRIVIYPVLGCYLKLLTSRKKNSITKSG